MRFHLKVLFLFLFFSIFLSGWFSDFSLDKKTFKIGVIVPGSIEFENRVQIVKDITSYVVSDINSDRGILGLDIELVFLDGECSVLGGGNAVRKFIDLGIDYVIGGLCSEESIGASFVAGSNNVLLISPISRSSKLSSTGNVIFMMLPSFKEVSEILAKNINLNKNKNIGIISHSTEFSNDLVYWFKNYLGDSGNIIFDEKINLYGNNFSNLENLNYSNIDSLLFVIQNELVVGDVLDSIPNFREMDFDIYSNSLFFTGNGYKNYSSDLVGVKTVRVDPIFDLDLKEDFLINFELEMNNSDINYFPFFYVASYYDSLYLLKEVLNICGGVGVDCVKTELYNLNYSGMIKNLRFDSNGVADLPISLYEFDGVDLILAD